MIPGSLADPDGDISQWFSLEDGAHFLRLFLEGIYHPEGGVENILRSQGAYGGWNAGKGVTCLCGCTSPTVSRSIARENDGKGES